MLYDLGIYKSWHHSQIKRFYYLLCPLNLVFLFLNPKFLFVCLTLNWTFYHLLLLKGDLFLSFVGWYYPWVLFIWMILKYLLWENWVRWFFSKTLSYFLVDEVKTFSRVSVLWSQVRFSSFWGFGLRNSDLKLKHWVYLFSRQWLWLNHQGSSLRLFHALKSFSRFIIFRIVG